MATPRVGAAEGYGCAHTFVTQPPTPLAPARTSNFQAIALEILSRPTRSERGHQAGGSALMEPILRWLAENPMSFCSAS